VIPYTPWWGAGIRLPGAESGTDGP
jgi:hypothetical protein